MNCVDFSAACPVPLQQYPRVLMAHGGGGRLMHQMIERMFLPAFADPASADAHDSTVLESPPGRLAFTTDSYVVRPILFPGGDIGSMAIHGTVNDLAMSGARPLYLSAGFILEEGLAMDTLWQVIQSMSRAAQQCGVRVVTGDTKVVDQGRGDGLFINTSGVGAVGHALTIAPKSVQPGDVLLVNGDLGRHGMAIMAVREGLQFHSPIQSDSAPVWEPVRRLLDAGIALHCLRDLTRGGLAATLNEIAAAARVRILLDEPAVPVREEVHAACEMLGLDPLHVACEGRFAAFVPARDAERALAILREVAPEIGAARIGHVESGEPAAVILKTALGSRRILDMPSGEQLPRIC